MIIKSINPSTGSVNTEFNLWSKPDIESALQLVANAVPEWQPLSFEDRKTLFLRLAEILRERQEALARLITLEMGKLLKEARGEIEKCAWVCEYYAENGAGFLADDVIKTDARSSYVTYQPLGIILAIMPWNFPFWQVFRCAVPAMMAGNCCVLKHASNVPQCAVAMERVITDAGFPEGVFRTFLIKSDQVADIIRDPRIQGVSLTGSKEAGQKVAAIAGEQVKKCVMELGGSDPFVVLPDADLEAAVKTAVTARFQNGGQSCIAAKRFIVTPSNADEFVERFKAAVEKLRPGDPMEETSTLAPMARSDLRDTLHAQVTDSIDRGAVTVTGCAPIEGPGNYYQASILDQVNPETRAYHEELFGPVACVIRAEDEEQALQIANDSVYGLGGSVWTRDLEKGERFVRRVAAGACFVNGLVKSDPRLPFGGIKGSGFGRELSRLGIQEFVNAKTVWIGES